MIFDNGSFNDEFPAILNICKNEKIEIRHQEIGCFCRFGYMLEFLGNRPVEVNFYRLKPNWDISESPITGEKEVVTLTRTDIKQGNELIWKYFGDPPEYDRSTGISVYETTSSETQLTLYRNEIIFATGSFPDDRYPRYHHAFLYSILSRTSLSAIALYYQR